MRGRIKYWGYVHVNGSVHLKRYFSAEDLAEGYESPFVKRVIPVFEAEDTDMARLMLNKKVQGDGGAN